MIISKKASFDAAHFLPGYQGKCANIHGHSWVVEVSVRGQINQKTGMVIDFKYLSKFLDGIVETFDHTLINNIIEMPTAENIMLYIATCSESWCKDNQVGLYNVMVWETPNSCVSLI